MEPAEDDGSRPEPGPPAAPASGCVGTRTRGRALCGWCGQPAAYTWTLADEVPAEPVGRPLGDELAVCAHCQALTLAGDDAGLLDRVMDVLARRIPFPYASAFVREQEAARLAHWIARRTTVRPC